MNEQEYVESRLDDQAAWYEGKSQWHQRRFKQLRSLEIVAAAAIPFVAAVPDPWLAADLGKVLMALLGVVVAALTGLLSLYRFQETWVEYRATAEALKSEKLLFLTRTDPYAGDDRFPRFVRQVESLLSGEHESWAQRTREKPGEGGPPSDSEGAAAVG